MKNASPLEIASGVIALSGMVASLLGLLHYIADLRHYHAAEPNAKRRIVARRNVRTEAGRLAKLAALLAIGIVALLTPAPIRPQNVTASHISAGLIIAVLVIITGLTIWDYWDDLQLRRLLEAEDRESEKHRAEHHRQTAPGEAGEL